MTDIDKITRDELLLPFTRRAVWLDSENECRDLCRVRAYLVQGTRPNKKETKIHDDKRHLQKVVLCGCWTSRRAVS